jgi:hypothetical protein
MLLSPSTVRTRLLAGLLVLGTAFLASAAQAQIRIVVIGDSNIAGKGVPSDQAYPARLEQALRAKGYDVVVQNAGVNGDTTTGVLARLDSAVPNGTQIAIVCVGVNDIVHGSSPAAVAANLSKIGGRLRARGIETLMIRSADFQGSLIDRPDLHVEPTRTPGRYHLNATGYDIVVARTLPQVVALIAHVKSKRT